MAKIESLTPEQWAEVHQHRDQVIERCLNQPLDHNKIGQSIGACYEAVGEKPPLAIVWAPGPVAALAWSAILRAEGEKPEARQLGDQLRDQLWDQLWGQLRDQLGDQLQDQLWRCIDLWSGAYWMASYASSLPIAGLPASTRLDTLTTAAQSTGWWWPMRGICVMTDRPTAIHRDQQGRLHHDTGPALTWADGYSLTSWHGITVPADFHLWDVETALAQPNAEVRRCGVERLGWDAITDRLALVAMADDPGNPGQRLALYDLGDLRDLYEEPARILICHNASLDKGGHRRAFGLPVPAHHDDPIAAAADLFGIPADQYRALARAS